MMKFKAIDSPFPGRRMERTDKRDPKTRVAYRQGSLVALLHRAPTHSNLDHNHHHLFGSPTTFGRRRPQLVQCCAMLCCVLAALGSAWYSTYGYHPPPCEFCLILVGAAVLFLFPFAFISGPSLDGLAVAASSSTKLTSLSHLIATNAYLASRRAAGLGFPRIGPFPLHSQHGH
ncbi:hypothetical protein LZ30DRAFT_474375 [Colletotrichum cereale]|nr:hypothetical protein LZ30DRAFT_474375 [Colletotrichum cereale]